MIRRIGSILIIAALGWPGCRLTAQQSVTREQAVAAALARGARAALGRSDTAAALGATRAARVLPNPSISITYTKSTPQYHAIADLPLDLPWLRAARIGAAEAARSATRYDFAFTRAAVRLEVDTLYTRALATREHARLSRRTALDADSLRAMAQLRRDVGDVSDLDVRLAAVNAGQLENTAVDDSLAAVEALLELQLAMGLQGSEPVVALADSLVAPDSAGEEQLPRGEVLPVAAAAEGLRSAERNLTLARRSIFAPSLQFGVENRDPTGQERGLLPTVGLALPVPLFNWNGGVVAQAAAARDRARAELDLVQRETNADRARARRELAAGIARLRRDRDLLTSADLVATMSLRAYAEGAVALPSVLEAQRSAREALGRYIDDLAAAANAAATVRLLSTTTEQS